MALRHTFRNWIVRLAGPRPGVLAAAVVLIIGLFGAFAYEFVHSQRDSRRQAERSFRVQAAITAELTSSLFGSSASSGAAAAAKQFGGRMPSSTVLTAIAKRSHLAYLLILDSRGIALAGSADAPDAARDAPIQRDDLRHALKGEPWLSDLRQIGADAGPVIEWALPFRTKFGPRVELQAFEARSLLAFLRSYLKKSGASPRQSGYIVDGAGRMIADSTGVGKLGSPVSVGVARPGGGRYRSAGAERYVADAQISGSDWRVLLTEPTATLYPALAGGRSWILSGALAAFGLIGLLAVALLRRMLIGTDRVVAANRALGELNATLEDRVADRTAVAEQRAEELARSNNELEQFASVASHDLQEPLRKIRMYAQRLPKRLGDALPEEASTDLVRIHDAAERMQRLIDDLLSFARVTSRHREFEAVDLSALTEDVVADLEARVHELDAEIEIGDLPVVAADQAQMSQLLQNLISNALKFHRPDIRPVVRIDAETNGDRCRIIVEDNGIGFDSKYAERIFSAFERLHSRSDYEGTGIGLSIARKIARRHGGELTAYGAPGRGAVFTLTLPVIQQPPAIVEEAA
jgi:signal transduction histidine kinase